MGESRKVQVPWADIDTLLLDMDGTLLDLAFDNFFWLELVPREYALRTGVSLAAARDEVTARYAPVVGTLPWYCLEHWTGELGLDLAALKRQHRHRIRYLPRAEAFLALARRLGKRLVLVTNAHRVTLAIKCEQTRVDSWMDAVVSSHDYQVEKERSDFWRRLESEHSVDPERSLLLEDSLPVLSTAREFGIAHAIAISRPDTTADERAIDQFAAVTGVAELIDRPAD
jgi:HAD superfamily hydrolase (TIGR01509 family)